MNSMKRTMFVTAFAIVTVFAQSAMAQSNKDIRPEQQRQQRDAQRAHEASARSFEEVRRGRGPGLTRRRHRGHRDHHRGGVQGGGRGGHGGGHRSRRRGEGSREGQEVGKRLTAAGAERTRHVPALVAAIGSAPDQSLQVLGIAGSLHGNLRGGAIDPCSATFDRRADERDPPCPPVHRRAIAEAEAHAAEPER